MKYKEYKHYSVEDYQMKVKISSIELEIVMDKGYDFFTKIDDYHYRLNIVGDEDFGKSKFPNEYIKKQIDNNIDIIKDFIFDNIDKAYTELVKDEEI